VRARAYKIEYSARDPAARQGVCESLHVGGPGTIQSFNVTQLSSGYQYTFKVLSITPSGVEAPFDGIPAVTTPLVTPTGIYVLAVDGALVSFGWQGAAAGIAGAEAFVLPNDLLILVVSLVDGASTAFGPFGATSRSAQVGPLVLGVKHRASVVSRAATGDSVMPPIGAFVDFIPLPRPAGLRISSISATSLTLAFRSSLPWVSSSYIVRYRTTELSAEKKELSCVHLQSLESENKEQTCFVAGLSDSQVYIITVASTLNGFSEPVGAELEAVTPLGPASNVGVCYADYSEIAIEWLPPTSDSLPERYQISYTTLPEASQIVLVGGANVSRLVQWNSDIPQSGVSRKSWQRHTIKGLLPRTTYQFRVHSVSRFTGRLDPIGTGPVIASTRADRGGFLLTLKQPCTTAPSCPHIMAAPYSRASDRRTFQPSSLTMETWVKIAAQSVVEGEGTRRMGVLGNFYSVQSGLASAQDISGMNSGAKGHFGYGLFCDLEIPAGMWTCTMAVGLEGSSRGERCETSVPHLPAARWMHLAATYEEQTATIRLLINGKLRATTICGGADGVSQGARKILYEAPDPSVYLTPQQTGEGLIAAGLPMWGMGFAIGRLLVANSARTSLECAPIFFAGDVDQVRLWNYARSPSLVYSQAVLDTVPLLPSPPSGLIAYWPFDDPIDMGLCAQSLAGVVDAISGTSSALLFGAKVRQASSDDVLPIDKDPVLSVHLLQDVFPFFVNSSRNASVSPSAPSSPSTGTSSSKSNSSTNSNIRGKVVLEGEETVTVYVGDTLRFEAHLVDENPSDKVQLFLNVQGNFDTHPSGLIVEVTGRGEAIRYSVLQVFLNQVAPSHTNCESTLRWQQHIFTQCVLGPSHP
jgi:hypothetical protein